MNIVDAYRKHKHLHKAAEEVGIPWQTLYWQLKKLGVPVTGDKSRYGSSSDRLAAKAENHFKALVPFAKSMNRKEWQSKIDFTVGDFGVDVKCGRIKRDRWMFCIKKQECIADFFVCFAMSDAEKTKDSKFLHTLLIPGEIARKYTTISLSNKVRSKWWDYEISDSELVEFFEAVKVAA